MQIERRVDFTRAASQLPPNTLLRSLENCGTNFGL